MPEKPQAMTGRRRIHAAFRHEAVDRVPIFDQSISSGLASKVMGREMLLGGGELRFREVEARFESPHAGAEFEERMIGDVATFYKTMGYDMFRLPWRDTRKASRRLDEKTYLFGTDDNSGKEAPWEIYRFSAESDNWHQMDSWLAGGNVDRLFGWLKKENSLWQGPDRDPSRFDSLRRFKSLLGDDTALAVTVASLMVPMWETAWLMALEIEPELVAGELDRQVEQGLADLEEVAVIGVDVIHAGGDFCLNSGPVYSPATFDSLFLPRLQRLAQACSRLGLYYVFRTDGVTWPVADSLFGDSGVHGYGEIDFGAGMRLGELRKRFPRLTLFGNMDCGGALVFGTEQDVRKAARENLEETGGTGHIFGASNEVLPETPKENYLAMLDEADRFRPSGGTL